METFAVYMRLRGSLSAPLPLASETLFGAVCWGISQLGLRSDLAVWLRGYVESQQPGPFTFSSACPVFFDNDDKPLVQFFPQLETFTLTHQDFESLVESYRADSRCTDVYKDAYRKKDLSLQSCTGKQARAQVSAVWKRLRKARFLSGGLLDLLARGQVRAREVLADILLEGGVFKHAWDGLMTMQEFHQLKTCGFQSQKPAFLEEAVQHNQIDRLAGSTVEGALFYDREVYFREGVGLWALLHASREEFENMILPALRYLGDTGLGANRSTGKGHFAVSVFPPPKLPQVDEAKAVMMLSTYLPAPDEDITAPGPTAYRLITLRAKREQKFAPAGMVGMTTTPVYKQALRVFAPGSVFPLKTKAVYGRLLQVVPDDQGGPVFQSCAALGLPIFVEEYK